MSLATNITNAMTRVATECKSLRTLINGNVSNLAALNTTAKSNLVAAINEVHAAIGSSGATINDSTVSTLTVWSSSKTDSEIDAAVAALVDAAPGTLDTINELAAALGDDPNFATTITSALAQKAPLASPTFTGTVTVPDGSFTIGKTTGLQAALDAKITGFTDPNADRIVFWDDSAGAYAALSLSGLTISGTTLSVDAATETAAGKVELATTAEATTGTDTTRAVTPAGLKAVADTKASSTHGHALTDANITGVLPIAQVPTGTTSTTVSLGNHTHTMSGITDASTAIPAAVPAASATVQGKVELATDAETITGSDTTRAITPANLMAAVGDTATNFVTTFEAGLV